MRSLKHPHKEGGRRKERKVIYIYIYTKLRGPTGFPKKKWAEVFLFSVVAVVAVVFVRGM